MYTVGILLDQHSYPKEGESGNCVLFLSRRDLDCAKTEGSDAAKCAPNSVIGQSSKGGRSPFHNSPIKTKEGQVTIYIILVYLNSENATLYLILTRFYQFLQKVN